MHKLHNFLLLGSGAHFTRQVLKQLLACDCPPVAYVQYGCKIPDTPTHFKNIPIESSRSLTAIDALINQYDIACYYQNSLQLADWVQQQNIDFLLVACWPELISTEVINSVNCAAVNLHPSLLPAFRGFDPISDQLNSGNSTFGVSLHLLNESFDCGDIVLQEVVKPDATATGLEIEARCAKKGAQLFIHALQTYSQPGWNLIKQPVD
jgi:methionyl-tRNA formyltransferase